jgi:hypothetical protein
MMADTGIDTRGFERTLVPEHREMGPEEYERALHELGTLVTWASRHLHVDERTSRRWATGQFYIPPLPAKLLRLMVHKGITLHELETLGNKPLKGFGHGRS